jgi:signal transduction histidine kinase
MLYCRDSNITVSIDCPEDLVIQCDRLRLKQIVLNLGRNALKFVKNPEGFIRFRATVVDDSVIIHIEDSGPGIPANKRNRLFNKFQESLDSLHQGTG